MMVVAKMVMMEGELSALFHHHGWLTTDACLGVQSQFNFALIESALMAGHRCAGLSYSSSPMRTNRAAAPTIAHWCVSPHPLLHPGRLGGQLCHGAGCAQPWAKGVVCRDGQFARHFASAYNGVTLIRFLSS